MTAELVVSGVPTVVAERLSGIYREHSDLNERAVLEDARSDDSPLHGYFEWDDGVAAEAHRLTQAASLIRRVKVTVIAAPEAEPIRVRAYIARRELTASAENIEPGSYIAIEDVAGRTSYEVSVRESIKRDLVRLRRKYDDTGALFDLAAEVFTA